MSITINFQPIIQDPAPITNKKVNQLKDPYALEVAAKLDSATDISKLRMENQQLETADDLKLVPNESSSRIKNTQKETDSKKIFILFFLNLTRRKFAGL